ncbi:ionotropic receptor 75a [Phlebotomus papatasi]|uniref:ionotropic receptor 75a n=1 Tax=Phlebotomus papatasi TaxID=29031 RepID=UPI0024841C63|nr:ionotropic receptor 75a [Phlebotomus papatasi]
MKLLKCLIFLLSVLFTLSHSKISSDLVQKYLISVRNVKSVVMMLCSRKDLGRLFNDNSIYLTNYYIGNEILNLSNFFSRYFIASCGIVVDCECPGVEEVLQNASNYRYFNLTYNWLLFGSDGDTWEQFLDPIFNIEFSSDLVFVQHQENSSKVDLVDVYSLGRHRGSSLIGIKFAEFDFLPTYALINYAIPFIKSGDWAFHCELTEAYTEIAKHFDASEICDLRIVTGLMVTEYVEVILPKLSQYREMMKIAFMRLQEVGLVKRALTIYRKEKPECISGITVFAIDRDNVTSADVDYLMKLPGKTLGITTFVKYQSHLNYYLQEMYNYTMKYRVTRAWAGHLPSGYRLGLLGVMARGEADISMSAVFTYINRFDEYDFLHRSYMFEVGFVFRVGSHSSATDASLLAPFENDVWISLIVTVFIVVIIGFIVRITFVINKHPFSGSTAKDFVDIFAALCQQGVDPIPENTVQKIIIFMTLFLAFFLYNYYTSSVVGVLLSSPVKGPTTPEEILASNYKVCFDDVAYHKIMFREKKKPIIEKMYIKKVLGQKRGPKDLPTYALINYAIPFIKSGDWAFHCELTEAYTEIAKHFDASEICDLRIVTGLMVREYVEAILPKLSQYREMMKIGFMRLQEVGLVKRALTIYRKEKPECTSGITVFAVGFQAVSSAFYVLIFGMITSIFILIGEILWKRYSSRQKSVSQKWVKPIKPLKPFKRF